jgi:hypothetical protein
VCIGPELGRVLVCVKPQFKRFGSERVIDTSLSDRMFGGTEINVGNSKIERVKSANVDRVNVIVGVEVGLVSFRYFPGIVNGILP